MICMQFRKTISKLFHPQRSNNHRPQLLRSSTLFLLSFVITLSFAFFQKMAPIVLRPGGVVLGIASNINSNSIISQTNNQRASQGLSSLEANGILARAAQAKAQDMFAKQYWAHVSPQGKQPWSFIAEAGYEYAVAGENLARDFQTSEEVVTAWMASPTHKANILHKRYTQIGVAVVNGTLEGMETTLVVQMFGTPATSITNQESTSISIIRDGAVASGSNAVENQPVVLSGQALQAPTNEDKIIISPVKIMKGVILALLLLIVLTLLYDFILASHTNVVRMVGKNLAHVLLFLTVIYIVLYYKSGIIL